MNLTSLLSIWALSGASDAEQSEDDTVLRESGYSGVSFVLRESMRQYFVGAWRPTIWRAALYNCTVWHVVMPTQVSMAKEISRCTPRWQRALWHKTRRQEVPDDLYQFTSQVIYGDKKSSAMADARAAKWKTMKNKSFIRLPSYADSLRQHCLCANYLAYLVRHPSLKHHPSPVGHGWELVCGRCPPHATCPPNASACTRASWRGGGRWEQRCWCGRARWLCAENKRAIRI